MSLIGDAATRRAPNNDPGERPIARKSSNPVTHARETLETNRDVRTAHSDLDRSERDETLRTL